MAHSACKPAPKIKAVFRLGFLPSADSSYLSQTREGKNRRRTGIMLARAVRKPVTSEAFRTASREPSGENRRSDPLGEVFFDSGDVSRETILTEEQEEAKVGIIRVVADAG